MRWSIVYSMRKSTQDTRRPSAPDRANPGKLPATAAKAAIATLEIEAMGAIVSALAGLNPASRDRVVSWVRRVFRPAR
jgi:hypothetical protein